MTIIQCTDIRPGDYSSSLGLIVAVCENISTDRFDVTFIMHGANVRTYSLTHEFALTIDQRA